ncbi:uncharacterized protein LOC144657565 [Oculina patagonica]
MADRWRWEYPHGPNPTQESLKMKEKFAAYYKATGKWKPPEQCAALLKDPAIEKFGWIRENTDMFFKFKPRSVRNAVIFCLLIPGALVYFFKKQPAKDVM